MASADADVVEASLQTLATFLKKTVGKYSIRDASLTSRLLAFAQGWGCKEEGLGLTACALENGCDTVAYELGRTLHFEFYRVNVSSTEAAGGLQTIHLSDVHYRKESDLELLNMLVKEYGVPPNLRFSLFSRLRFARAFGSLASRQQYTCIRLYAFMVLVQASSDADDLVSFFNTEPEFTNELVSLLSFEDSIPEKIRILSLRALVALSQDRSRQLPAVLASVTSGGQRGILSSLMQKAIDSVSNGSSKWSVVFAEALLSLVTALISSPSGCSAMREAGFIPTLLPLLKDTNPQHLHLVGTAVHVLEGFMDYSNPAAALFRDLGGLDETINRLKVEVSAIEDGLQQPYSDYSRTGTEVTLGASAVLDDIQPLYSESLLAYHRRLLLKALLRAINLGTYAPGSTGRIYGSEESLLPQCLCIIFRRAKDFGGGVFSLAATVMSDLIQKDPTCFAALDAAGLPSAFMDAIMDGVLSSADVLTCLPQSLNALCLNNNGLQAVKDRNALSCFVKIFTSKAYLRALAGDAPGALSSGLDELMRHASTLRGPGVDMLIEILNTILKLGSVDEVDSSPSVDSIPCPAPVPMETDSDIRSLSTLDEKELPTGSTDPIDLSSDATLGNVESYLPDYVSNACRLLETILQNSEACRLFVEKRGIEAVLQMFSLPLLPVSVSVGQSVSVAFKNFSAQYSASLAKTVCSFLKEHLNITIEVLNSIEGTPLVNLEPAKQTKVMRCLTILEGILSFSISMLKGTTTVVSELGAGDADVLKDIGRVYREVLWQISLSCDTKVEPKQSVEVETENADAASSTATGRESDDDTGIPIVRYMNPVSIRSGSQSQWARERDFLSVIRSGEGLSRRNRHGLTRIRGGRTGRHLDSFNTDSEVPANVLEPSSSLEHKKKSPDILASDILAKLSGTMRSFYTALLKGLSSPNRRRAESGLMSSVAKNIGTVLSKNFLEALNFSGYSNPAGLDMSLSVKCRYLGKVVHDMAALTFDSRRRICYTAMVNNFYVSGAFKELLTTFEATSQLLWSLPPSIPMSGIDSGKASEGSKLEHNSWLLDTLQCYCRLLEYFVNSSLLLSPTSPSQAQLLVQPVAVGLSIGLFPVPRDPEAFVRMLQSQVLDVILPVWNHPMFPHCSAAFTTSVLSLVSHIYSGVGETKRNRSGVTGSSSQRVAPPPDEATISTIVEMGFSRARAEEALRRVESNSVEMAMDWLCTHAEDPVHEDDELAQALALSLGSSTETSKADNNDKSVDTLAEEGQMKAPPVDDILGASMKLFQSGDSLAFPLTDLLATLCNRNKGEDRLKVASYLIQQLKLCSSDLSNDASAVSSISHILALLLSEDTDAREIAAQNGIVPVAIDILKNLRGNQLGKDVLTTKSTSALLLILDNLLQSKPKISSAHAGVASADALPDSAGEHVSVAASVPDIEKKVISDACEESFFAFEKIFGKSTGYLSMEECHAVLEIACDMLKQQVPAVIMQAVLQLCARLTKTHALALQYLENGGMAALFDLPRSCFFAGYDTLASAIIRHLLEDPQTLQTAMELEIRQTLIGGRHSGRVPTRIFLTSMVPVISRDPVIFTKAAAAVCQLESSAGRTVVVFSKEKEKEKDRFKVTGAEAALPSSEPVRIPEMKVQDGPGKGSKGHKKIPANLAQVIDQLLEIILQFPCSNSQEDCSSYQAAMEVDEPITNVKGKSKIDEVAKGDSVVLPERSAALAKVIFVLKLLSDILLMYVHAISVVLRRDSEICQLRVSSQLDSPGQGGVVHHVLHKLLPLSSDKSSKPGDLREKLSEKASWFLVVLCGRSSEGRRRVISELVKALLLYSNLGSNSLQSSLLPDRKVLAFVELVYSVLSKNTSSSSLSVSGYSPDIARGMIDGGVVPCLSSILQAIDLDHPDASKVANFILKALESLTRAANASEQPHKSDVQNKKKSNGSQGRSDDQTTNASANVNTQHNENQSSEQEARDAQVDGPNPHEGAGCTENNHGTDVARSDNQDMRAEGEGMQVTDAAVELAMEFTGDEMEEGDLMHDGNRIGMEFHIEHRADDGAGDEDDDMGGEGEEEDEEEDDGEDEDEDIAEDGTALMSLADTDVDDHDDAGFGDEYHDEMIDDEEDDYHENRVIEVRWREALDGFHHLQVAQSGSGLIDVPSEPFEGVNVDDLFGLRRTLGFERRRQTTRSFDRNNTDGGLQHPLLSRPPQSGDASLWSSGGNVSRDSESSSGAGTDVSQFYMFDTPPFLYDFGPASLFGDRSGGTAPPPLTDYSVGMDSSQLAGRRGPGDGRWADDGQPQAGNQASAIAQAVEEVFVSVLRGASSTETPVGMQSQNTSQPEQQLGAGEKSDSHVEMEGDPSHGVHGHSEVQIENSESEPLQTNQQDIVSVQGNINSQAVAEEGAAHESEILSSNPALHSMEFENENDPSNDLTRTDLQPSLSVDPVQHGADLGELDNLRDDQMQVGLTDVSSGTGQINNDVNNPEQAMFDQVEHPSVGASPDTEMNGAGDEPVQTNQLLPASEINEINGEDDEPVQTNQLPLASGSSEPVSIQNVLGNVSMESDHVGANVEPAGTNAIDPTFLEALPEDLRAEVLASQQSQSAQPPTYTPPSVEDIDPEFLAALPPDIQAEVLAQQRVQRLAQQSEGQPVDMDNASIIATLPADLREEVLLTSSEAVLSALPSPLLAEAQMLRDRAMSHYQARSHFGSSHRLTQRRNGLGFDRQSVMDRGVGVTIGRRTGAALLDVLKVKEVEGEPLLDGNALKALIRLLRLAQPLGKGLLQRLLLNLCAHSVTRATLVRLLLEMIKPEAEGTAGSLSAINPQRLYGCPSNVVYGHSQLLEGLPPLVLRRVLEILNYLATNHSAVANTLFYFEPSLLPESFQKYAVNKKGKGKEKVGEGGVPPNSDQEYKEGGTPLILLLKLLNRPLFRRSIAHVEQVMGLLQVVVYTAASRLESPSLPEQVLDDSQNLPSKASDEVERDVALVETETNKQNKVENGEPSISDRSTAPRLIDFDNKRAYFRSRIRQQHEQHHAGPLRISVRRAYVLEDSYNQLRMRSNQDLKGRLNVQFQGEEGIDAGGLTREWYQLLSRVIFDKGALLFTTVGNDATFQPNPNSVYQTEHLSYFKFVGRVVAKALFDGQLLDVYFTRSFYKHILGVKVTYHDIEAVDPDYYKNLKWLLENDVSDILDLTFSMDADEEKLILYEKTQVTDHELKPGGRNIRVTEETKHEYVDLVADHILTNAIRPQINSFLEGFNELVPRELISIFNDKELELLISGLPEIDLDDLKANAEYTGYTVASNVIQWFWEVASSFSKEDMARLLQFVTGTSKVPLEGFKALQGISGPQRFQIHKAYGAPERLPSAHTCFNQLDLPEYSTKEQLRERLLLAIHEASEGFGFG
ncbi:hypothetical protein SOVF_020560 [Spinacia oleracea]|nr:hypothetical protein SOVF_020560 [Spinacia oleracea]